jgi:hypothetical protein
VTQRAGRRADKQAHQGDEQAAADDARVLRGGGRLGEQAAGGRCRGRGLRGQHADSTASEFSPGGYVTK